MVIYYKTETNLIKYLKSIKKFKIYQDGGFLTKIGIKKRTYPEIYFHSGALNEFSKKLILNSKITIVNSGILKNKIMKILQIDGEKIEVILPAYEIEKYKKK